MRTKFKVGDMICNEHDKSRIGYVTKIESRPRSYLHVRWFDQTDDTWYSIGVGPVYKSLIKVT
jgi:hypothetical protein